MRPLCLHLNMAIAGIMGADIIWGHRTPEEALKRCEACGTPLPERSGAGKPRKYCKGSPDCGVIFKRMTEVERACEVVAGRMRRAFEAADTKGKLEIIKRAQAFRRWFWSLANMVSNRTPTVMPPSVLEKPADSGGATLTGKEA